MLTFPKALFGVPSLLIVVLFFLPWITLSCGGSDLTNLMTLESSGIVQADGAVDTTGVTSDMTFGMDSISGDIATASGFNLAMGELQYGSDIDMMMSMSGEADTAPVEPPPRQKGDYELFLIPGLALFALALVFISDKLLKGLYIGSAFGALFVWGLYWAVEIEGLIPVGSGGNLKDTLAVYGTGLSIQYEIGWWATGALLALMVLMGFLFNNDAV